MPAEQTTTRLNPAEETIRVGPLGVRFLVDGPDSNGSLSLFEVTIPAGSGLPGPPHSHDGFEETVYGLEGVLTWTLDGRQTDVGPGEALCIPRGVVHHFDNHGDVDAKALAVVTPGILGPDYFRDVAAVVDAAVGGPPDLAAIAAVMKRHGLSPAP